MAGIQEDLFELIQTLSVTEKRYFKVFATNHKSDNINYLTLFDALCELDRYDEEKLVKKLERKAKDKAKKDHRGQLNQDMHYLYKVLLQAIRQYNSKLKHITIRDLTSDAILLRDRGLLKQAEKRIAKAKEIARKYFYHSALLELNRLDRVLIWSLEDSDEIAKTNELIAEKDHILKILEEEMAYEDLYAQVCNAIGYQASFVKNEAQFEAIAQKISALFSQKEPDELSPNSRLRRYQTGIIHSMAERRFEDTNEFINQMFNWWESYDHLKEEEFFRYQFSLSGIITYLFNSNKPEEMMQLLLKIRERSTGIPNEQAMIFHFTINYELLYYLNTGKVHKAKDMLAEIEKGIQQYPLPIKKRISIAYNAAMACFFDEDYSYCETWLLRIKMHARNRFRKELIRMAFLLHVIILENQPDRQEKAILDAQKYFRKEKEAPGDEIARKKNKQFEEEILRLISKIMHAPLNQSEKAQHAQALKDYLIMMRSEPSSSRLYGIDELLFWCESKLKQKSLRSVFTEGSLPV